MQSTQTGSPIEFLSFCCGLTFSPSLMQCDKFDDDDDFDDDNDYDQLEEERFSMLQTQKLFRPLGWWVAGDITTVSVGLSRPPTPTLGPPWDRIIIQTPTGCVTTEETKPRKGSTCRLEIQQPKYTYNYNSSLLQYLCTVTEREGFCLVKTQVKA